MNSWIRNQVGLEFIQIHIESSIKSERGSYGGHNLANKTVEVGVGRPLNIQIPTTDVVDGLIVNHEGTVRVLQCCMGGQD